MKWLKAKFCFVLCLYFVIGGSSSLKNGPEHEVPSFPRFRLPTSIVPINYRIQTMPILDVILDYERFTSPSKIWIHVLVKEETDNIKLHAISADLNINHSSISVRITG